MWSFGVLLLGNAEMYKISWLLLRLKYYVDSSVIARLTLALTFCYWRIPLSCGQLSKAIFLLPCTIVRVIQASFVIFFEALGFTVVYILQPYPDISGLLVFSRLMEAVSIDERDRLSSPTLHSYSRTSMLYVLDYLSEHRLIDVRISSRWTFASRGAIEGLLLPPY